jgi:hypothetical protein
MKLITQTLAQRFQEVGVQKEETNPLIITKFFNPCGTGEWYPTTYYPEENRCFGLVTGRIISSETSVAWTYFSIAALERLRFPPFGLPIERDITFRECRFSEL